MFPGPEAIFNPHLIGALERERERERDILELKEFIIIPYIMLYYHYDPSANMIRIHVSQWTLCWAIFSRKTLTSFYIHSSPNPTIVIMVRIGSHRDDSRECTTSQAENSYQLHRRGSLPLECVPSVCILIGESSYNHTLEEPPSWLLSGFTPLPLLVVRKLSV